MPPFKPRDLFQDGFFQGLEKRLPRDFHQLDLISKAKAIEKILIDLTHNEKAYETLCHGLINRSFLRPFRQKILQKTIAHGFCPGDVRDLEPSYFQTFLKMPDHDVAKACLDHLTHELSLYCAWRLWSPKAPTDKGIFTLPEKPRPTYPFPKEAPLIRHDFSLCDHPKSPDQVFLEATYCLYCHKTQKDSCRTGYPKSQEDKRGGCPLDLPISEMTMLYAQGHPLAALVLAMKKNPLILATGHRICNDCMLGCIFQSQDPVDIPSVESQIVQEILSLPWGFEIIYLLSYWQPLVSLNPTKTPHRIMVVGMGPGGFTTAHGLLARGYHVYAVEGQVCSFPDPSLLDHPIEEFQTHYPSLENRNPSGFGGVMGYGITARWNKNLLDALQLILMRHPHFHMKDSFLFGKTFGIPDAFDLGMDHLVLAMGAGPPKIPSIPNILPKGMATASEFLMRLHQLKGGDVPLDGPMTFPFQGPVVVIGGGLTSIDAATECQVLLNRQKTHGKDTKDPFTVTLLYRQNFTHSPSVSLNPEEVRMALRQGILVQDHLVPVGFEMDETQRVKGVIVENTHGHTQVIPAKTVIIATGTHAHIMADLTDREKDRISIVGDMDDAYKGSVVKAMASGMKTAEDIHDRLGGQTEHSIEPRDVTWQDLDAKVVSVFYDDKESYGILTLHAPLAARLFQPGQFFRLSGFGDTPHRGIILSGFETDGPHLRLMFSGMGPVSLALRSLHPGKALSLMGPCGSPTPIPHKKRVLLIGAAYGTAILLPIARAMKHHGCHVDMVCHPRPIGMPFLFNLLKATTDYCHVATPEPHCFSSSRPWDHGLIIAPPDISKAWTRFLEKAQWVQNLQTAVNTSMFCLMQGVCASCLQKHINPDGTVSWIYSCTQQDQDALSLDHDFWRARMGPMKVS